MPAICPPSAEVVRNPVLIGNKLPVLGKAFRSGTFQDQRMTMKEAFGRFYNLFIDPYLPPMHRHAK